MLKLRRTIAAFMAAVITLASMSTVTASAENVPTSSMGDIDRDGKITSLDSLMVLRASVGLEKIPDEQIAFADINRNGILDSNDALTILKLSLENFDEISIFSSTFRRYKPKDGIDVSFWQEDIDFEKVKADGIDFVIIRAGGATDDPTENHAGIDPRRQGVDARFEENYAKAKAAGLNVGVYWYSFAANEHEAEREAESCLKAIEGKQFEYPVFYDLENKYQFDKGIDFCSKIMDIFCSKLRENGYYSAFYMSTFFATHYLNDDIKQNYDCWLAQWSGEVNYKGKYVMWQYSTGRVDGIRGDVDVDYSYVDYPLYIKLLGLNGWQTAEK